MTPNKYTGSLIILNPCFIHKAPSTVFIREAIKVEKKKKCDKCHTFGFDPLPPHECDNSQPIFLSFWHHTEQLWSKLFFPLEKVKILRIFSQNWSSEGS